MYLQPPVSAWILAVGWVTHIMIHKRLFAIVFCYAAQVTSMFELLWCVSVVEGEHGQVRHPRAPDGSLQQLRQLPLVAEGSHVAIPGRRGRQGEGETSHSRGKRQFVNVNIITTVPIELFLIPASAPWLV